MGLSTVTVHTAQSVRFVESGVKIEGERSLARQLGPTFDVFLMLGQSDEQQRGVAGGDTRRGSIIYEPFSETLTSEDRLLITAVELTGPQPVEWQLDGDPLPLAAPGNLIGYEARVVRVES